MLGIFGAIGGFIGSLWRTAKFWRISPIEGVRTGSTLAGGLMFLVMIFAIIGVILVTFGFDLNDVDLWLDAQGGWLDALGKLAIRVVLGFILLICAAIVIAFFFDRSNPEKPGWGMLIGALIVAYFCGVNIFAPL